MRNFFIFLFLFNSILGFSQYRIQGSIRETGGKPLGYVNVQLKAATKQVVAFTISDEFGNFKFKSVASGKYFVEYSSVGYEKGHISLSVFKDSILDVIYMIPKTIVLKEAIVQASMPVKVKQDTVVFNAASFINGEEVVVEDLLKKLPGIEVAENGTIKANGREIEKLMIDGDDFFDKGYKLLSKTMPVYSISKVELLNRYSTDALLKDIDNSDKVAINLKLNKRAKGRWFGNTDMSYGRSQKNLYNGKLNLMNFREKEKYYFFSNLNNTGNEAVDNVNFLMDTYQSSQKEDIAARESLEPYIDLQGESIGLRKDRTNFNNVKLLSFNTIIRPLKRLKLKSIALLDWDDKKFYNHSRQIYSFNKLENSQSFRMNEGVRSGFGEINGSYRLTDNSQIVCYSKYSFIEQSFYSSMSFNDNPLREHLKNSKQYLKCQGKYTNRLNKKNAVVVTARYNGFCFPQKYNVIEGVGDESYLQYTPEELIFQSIESQYEFWDFSMSFIHKSNENSVNVKLGVTSRYDELKSDLIVPSEITPVWISEDFSNDLDFISTDYYVVPNYDYSFGNINISAKMGLHLVHNAMKSKENNYGFLNPLVKLKWEINRINEFSTIITHNNSTSTIRRAMGGFVVRDYNRFSRGCGFFFNTNNSGVLLNYKHGGWSERVFVNTHVFYNVGHNYLSTNTVIKDGVMFKELIPCENKKLFNIGGEFDYFLKNLATNVGVDAQLAFSDFKDQVNNIDLRRINTRTMMWSLELRSAFKGSFNYHLGSKFRRSIVSVDRKYKSSRLFSYLDLYLKISKRFELLLKSDLYTFYDLDIEDRHYLFVDFKVKYDMLPKKVALSFSGLNMMDYHYFSSYSVSPIVQSSKKNEILPRFLLLKIEYRI